MSRRARIASLAAATLLLCATSASAHVTEQAGDLSLTFGWGSEPPIVGLENSIEVEVAGASGSPAGDGGDSLQAEVAFGGERKQLELAPGEEPGVFAAALIPTRPGTYSLHITGGVDGQRIDIESTCSPETFECVETAADLQFPVADPSAGELAEGLERTGPRIDDAADTADTAKIVALAAIVIAAIALGAAGAGVVMRRKSG